ncbi:MAG TPA: S8 family serine peptidase [Burkholderiaceae bacterium]|nr:S8 family serine peptidase [Burkholderiaceae bacterium]
MTLDASAAASAEGAATPSAPETQGGAPQALAAPLRSAEGDWAKGRVLVMPRPGLSAEEVGKLAGGEGGKARKITSHGLYVIELPGNASEKAVAARLANNPHLKFAEVDRLVAPSFAPNDPYTGSQWHLSKIGAATAWDVALGSGVTIAILDTGVDASHPDLAGSIVAGWNFYNNTADTTDVYNHGTGVAGTAAAAINNALGVASVAGQARIMPMKISDDTGYGSWSAMAQALSYAADRGVRVANISYNASPSSSVRSAAQYFKDKGGLVFVSAGNNGTRESTSATTALIGVSATDSNDARTSWSSYGAHVSLSAPGTGIYTTTRGGGYVSEAGTSFSSPVAAGAAALVMAANPKLSSLQVEQILFATAQDLGTAGRDEFFGYGRVDVGAAVKAAMNTAGSGTADTQAPAASISAPVANSTVSGLVSVNVGASDNTGVAKVELWVNGKLLATDTSAPYGFSWDSKTAANGSASLEARAYDAAGNLGSSGTVAVTVSNVAVADTAAPTVSISNPADGARVSGNVQIRVTATDNNGSAGITQSLFINGSQVAQTTGGSLSFNWNTRKVASGTYTIQATARDQAGNSTSQTVRVTR